MEETEAVRVRRKELERGHEPRNAGRLQRLENKETDSSLEPPERNAVLLTT